MILWESERKITAGAALMVWLCFACAISAAPAKESAEKPQMPEQASRRAHIAIADVLLDNPTDEDLFGLAKHYRRNEEYDRASVYGLMALRGKKNDPTIEYELACNFSLWGQKPLAMRFLNQAAEHGFWGYPVIKDDTDLDAIKTDPAFPAALAKVKAAFDREAPKHAPGMTVKLPKGTVPASGWPVFVSLHGWGSSRHDFDDVAELMSESGFVGITLDANQVMGPDAYDWTNRTAQTHERVQAALKNCGAKVDFKHVYLHGFSQGAMHAVCLLADHPDLYAGAISNSPGSIAIIPKKLANAEKTGSLVLSLGSQEHPSTKKAVEELEKLWTSGKRQVNVIHFEGGHQLPPDAVKMFKEAAGRWRTEP